MLDNFDDLVQFITFALGITLIGLLFILGIRIIDSWREIYSYVKCIAKFQDVLGCQYKYGLRGVK